MTRSAPGAVEWNRSMTALLVIGWILWLAHWSLSEHIFGLVLKKLTHRH